MGGAKNCPETPRQKMIGMMYLVGVERKYRYPQWFYIGGQQSAFLYRCIG